MLHMKFNKSSSSLYRSVFFYPFWLKLLQICEKTFCWWAGKSEPGSFQRIACQGGIAGLDVLIKSNKWSKRFDQLCCLTAKRLHQVQPASILEQANGKLICVFLSLGPHYRMQHLTPGDGKEVQKEIISKYAVNQELAKIRKVSFYFIFHFRPRPDSSRHPAWRAWGAAIRSDLVGPESVRQISAKIWRFPRA